MRASTYVLYIYIQLTHYILLALPYIIEPESSAPASSCSFDTEAGPSNVCAGWEYLTKFGSATTIPKY